MIDTSEKDFEARAEAHLVANSYTKRLPEQYDRSLCVDPDTLFDFIRSTQAKTWGKLKAQHGEQVKDRFLKRLVKEIETRGTLDLLRRGVTDLGCHFDLAYFRPETTMNEEHARLYKANIISVVRQLKYSQKNDNSIDLVLFVNGLPVITAELKNPLKGQDFKDAIWQYRNDRDPKEPLLAFKRCLAHFPLPAPTLSALDKRPRTAPRSALSLREDRGGLSPLFPTPRAARATSRGRGKSICTPMTPWNTAFRPSILPPRGKSAKSGHQAPLETEAASSQPTKVVP